MASLNLDLNYFDHLKTLRLVARLGAQADVLPLRLWAYVGKHHPESGCLDMLEAELEQVCHWWGEKGVMVAAMVEVGFIERKNDNLFAVHDWLDHSGHLGAYKKRAKKAAQKRWGMLQASASNAKNEPSNATSIPKQCPSVTVLDVSKRSVAVPPNPQTSLPSATSTAPANGQRPKPLTPGTYSTPDDEILGPEEFAKIKAALKPQVQAAQGGQDDVF